MLLSFKEGLIPCSISKSGVIVLTCSIARDYGKKDFRVNVILPGVIKIEGTKKLMKESKMGLEMKLMRTGYLFNNKLLLSRWENSEEVAKAIFFLSSNLANYV